MAKNKSKARQQRRPQPKKSTTAPLSAAAKARELEQSKRATKTLIQGAIIIAALSAFFGFKWDDKSLFDRLVGADEAPVSAQK